MDETSKVREDIAFIRQTLEAGRAYARMRSPDFAVWGALVALGYLGVYAHVAGLLPLTPGFVWWPLVAIGWAFSTRSIWSRRQGTEPSAAAAPAIRSLRALWLGLGIAVTMLALLQFVGGGRFEWIDIAVAGLLGLSFFVSAAISGIRWLYWIAAGWWAAQCVFVLLEGRDATLLAGAGFMIALLCVPGLVLWLGRPERHG